MASPAIDRTRRVAGLIQRELASLIAGELGDPRVEGVTITDVKVTRDLRQATIYVSRLDEARQGIDTSTPVPDSGQRKPRGVRKQQEAEGEAHEYVGVLNGAAGYLRRQLGARLTLRSTPNLSFRYDDTLARGFRISRLIDDALEPELPVDSPGENKGAGGSTPEDGDH